MSCPTDAKPVGKAEQAFRDAFERLKRNKPQALPVGTPVSQNNVAREAACDPTALKKKRFPSLVREIQEWVERNAGSTQPSTRQAVLGARKKNRSLKDVIEALKLERDAALSLLVEADARIVDLTLENARLTAGLRSNVTAMGSPPTERR